MCQACLVKKWWRTALVAILVALTGVIAPVSVVAAWAHTQISDTEAFVAAYAPLADDPAVQQAVAEKVSDAIQTRLDLPSLTQELLGNLTGSRPIASRLLPSLTGPLNSMVSDFIDKQTLAFVSSDAFSTVWETSLRATHTQFVALLNGDETAAVTAQEGRLQLQLGPFVEAVKQRLVANGFPIAEKIPEVTTAVDLAQVDPQTVATVQAAYRLLSVVADWLPWLLLLLPALALFVARDLRRTVIACGTAVVLGLLVLWAALAAAAERGVTVAVQSGFSPAAAIVVWDGAVGSMRGPALALGVTALVITFLAWLTTRTTKEPMPEPAIQ
jgi:hypothetical protein